MISVEKFYQSLKDNGLEFFTGVPDSLLKSICAYIMDHAPRKNNIIAANEGAAIGLAAGYHLSTGKIPVVYMQNSGEGNAVNPLMSLTDKEVYHIPVLLMIGWRGEPGIKDEPQHKKQGMVTIPLLEAMGIKYSILSQEETQAQSQIKEAVSYMKETKETYALIVKKDTFDAYKLQKTVSPTDLSMGREDAIKIMVDALGDKDIVVSTTGMISRELFEYRENLHQGHQRDFLTVGSMGHASQIALGIALQKPERKVFCFDGDGAAIMHLGSMAITASMTPENYHHVVFNNGAHDSVGGQPTVGHQINLKEISLNCGYKNAWSVSDEPDLRKVLPRFISAQGPVLLEIKVRKGNRKDLGRPTTTPVQNKEDFMKCLLDE